MKSISKVWVAGLILTFCAMESGLAEMRYRDGFTSNGSLPEATMTENVVFLEVPFKQQKPWLCVPTSSSMILEYFGESHSPELLKKYAEGHKRKSKRNKQFTYWVDMRRALRRIGHKWRIKDYRRNRSGFSAGMRDIKASLRKGLPVMVDVHLGAGHTFVVIGFDDNQNLIYVRDPDIPSWASRVLSYKEFRKSWHNHRFGKSRSAFFSRRK